MTPNPRPSSDSPSSWLDRECDKFERAWNEGYSPRIEDVLAGAAPELRPLLLKELLAIEIELRCRRGEQIQRAEYFQRFPDAGNLLDDLWPSFSAAADATQSLATGESMPDTVATLARYRDLRFFRRGGLGVLYRAMDEELNREAVIKFINDKCLTDAELKTQFNIEAEITSRLGHPGVAPVYGIGQDWYGRPFYVMRLIHGRELRQAIQEYHAAGGPAKRGQENRERLFTLLEHLTSACNTVAYAHDVGIVHCDIKPSNIMIGKYGETFVLDWGLATSFERTSTFVVPHEVTMRPRAVPGGSSGGHRGGTLGYMSPEQLSESDAITPASDVYSLGATLYEILTGQPPFDGHNPEVIELIRSGRFSPPREAQRGVTRRLEAICLKAMSLSPRMRYGTAKQLAVDLQNWMRDDEVQAAPDRWIDRAARFARRNRSFTLATFLATIVVAVAAMWTHLTLKHATQEQELRELVESNFTTALDTFEDLCRPLANGEMNNLGVFRPFADKIQNFTTEYLASFEQNPQMQFHTGRVYELRATVSRIISSDTEQALRDYQRAEDVYRLWLDRNDVNGDFDRRLANIHLSQARLYIQRNEYDAANYVLSDTVEQLKALHGSSRESALLKRLLAEAYHCRGEVFLERTTAGNRHESLESSQTNFEESRKLRQELVASATQGIERRNHERDLARSQGYLGDLYLAQGNLTEARKSYQDSKNLREGLYRNNPLDPEHRFQYARGLANFGFLERVAGGNLPAAIEMLTEAEQVQVKLAGDFPDVANFQLDHASTLNHLAEMYLFASQDEPAKAAEYNSLSRENVKKAEAVYGRLHDPSRPREQKADRRPIRGLATSFVLRAILERASDPVESSRLARDAAELIREHLGSPQMLNRDELVALALARSLQGQTDDALDALSLAVDRGENSASRIEKHRTLGFQALAEDATLGPKYDELCKRLSSHLALAR